MIRYALKCDIDHEFEAWFSSSSGFDDQVTKGQVECPMCGSRAITKAIMSPMVRTHKGADSSTDAQRLAETLYRLRKHVETTHDYVGDSFATEARDIHEGLAPDRPIYGEATPDEVKSLIEDGVPVAALPVFTPAKADTKAIPVPKPPAAAVDKKLN